MAPIVALERIFPCLVFRVVCCWQANLASEEDKGVDVDERLRWKK